MEKHVVTPILFYGVPAGCSFGSIVALEWLGCPYRLCRIEMPRVVTSAEYKRINPLGETPSLLTAEGALLSESLAITSHLGASGVERRLAFAPGTREHDRATQMLAFLSTSFFHAFAPLWYAYEHALAPEATASLNAYGRAKVEKAHADLEAMLGGQRWLLGEHRTFADAYFAGIARWSDYHGIDRRAFPGLSRLVETLEADPAVQFAHAIEAERPAVSTAGFEGEISLGEALEAIERVAA
jgi:glutathione S-transferase